MATKDQKVNALNEAISIAKEQARSGVGAVVTVLETSYEEIIKIVDKIEQTQD